MTMTKYYAEMKKGSKKIYGECCTLAMLIEWIEDNKMLGFELIGKIEKI